MDWSTVSAILLGGGISLVTSMTMFLIAQRVERKIRARERHRENAMEAFVGLQKLINTMNSIENLAQNLDREFEKHGGYDKIINPSSTVQPITGARPVIEDVTTKEMLFLFKGDGKLTAEIWLIQMRARYNDSIVEKYNKLRSDYQQFIFDKGETIEAKEGPRAIATLTKKNNPIAEIKTYEMNCAIKSLVSALKEDRVTIRRVTEDYISKAHEAYGDDFPAKRLDIREKSHANS